jgi:hypothetical protein
MSPSDDNVEQSESQEGEQVAVRDLIDFYRRWPEFRQTAMRLVECSDLSPSERQTVHWMILLVDRVSEHDLKPLKYS